MASRTDALVTGNGINACSRPARVLVGNDGKSNTGDGGAALREEAGKDDNITNR